MVVVRVPMPGPHFPTDLCCRCGGAQALTMVPIMLEHTSFLGPEGIQLVLPHCHACMMHAPRVRARPLVVGAAAGMISGLFGLVLLGFLARIVTGLHLDATMGTIVVACVVALGAGIFQLRRTSQEDAQVSVSLFGVTNSAGTKVVTLAFRSDAYGQRLMALVG